MPATLNGWRACHGLFGGGGSDKQARYQHCFVEVCVAALIADLTRRDLPLGDAIPVATAHQEGLIELVRDPGAELTIWVHREAVEDPLVISDEEDPAVMVATKVDLRRVLNNVIRGLRL